MLLFAAASGLRLLRSNQWRRSLASVSLDMQSSSPDRKQLVADEIPKLLLSSPINPDFFFEYTLGGGKNLRGIKFSRKFHLPNIADHTLVGSSHGFLFSVDPATANLHATDPLTGANLPLPPFVSSPHVLAITRRPSSGAILNYIVNKNYHMDGENKSDLQMETFFFEHRRTGQRFRLAKRIDHMVWEKATPGGHRSQTDHFFYDGINSVDLSCVYRRPNLYTRAILSPSLKTAVVILGSSDLMASARLDVGSWVPFTSPESELAEAIFHQGRLHAVGSDGTLFIFDFYEDDDDSMRSIDHHPPPLVSVPTPYADDVSKWFLVESPDGNDLFLVLREYAPHKKRTKQVRVFKLDKSNSKWDQVDSIGGIAMFLGFNHSASFYVDDFHPLRPNCIYFTEDNSNRPFFNNSGIFSLEDGSFQSFTLYGQYNPPQPTHVWLMPPTI